MTAKLTITDLYLFHHFKLLAMTPCNFSKYPVLKSFLYVLT